jgi:hypothetical protein
VTDTAQAINNFNETARAFTQTVNELPHQTRWELELLLYDTEELESVERALAAAESFATGAERISEAAETLPKVLGTELAGRLEEARATMVELDAALARAEGCPARSCTWTIGWARPAHSGRRCSPRCARRTAVTAAPSTCASTRPRRGASRTRAASCVGWSATSGPSTPPRAAAGSTRRPGGPRC